MEVQVRPGPWRLAPLTLGGQVIDPNEIPAAFDGDLYPAGWSKGGAVLGTG